jgi:hypothetical protein
MCKTIIAFIRIAVMICHDYGLHQLLMVGAVDKYNENVANAPLFLSKYCAQNDQ